VQFGNFSLKKPASFLTSLFFGAKKYEKAVFGFTMFKNKRFV
jgi:hypothetical protein